MNKEDRVLVTNIQHFCLDDGPGIRTTVFFKGCSVCCPWCANPENIAERPEIYYENDIKKTFGQYMTLQEIEEEVLKDIFYYDENGGVTWSGGEPLLQIKKTEPLLKKIKECNVHQVIETSLFVSPESLDIAMRYIDIFLVDIKILDSEKCNKVLGGNIILFLNNVKKLFEKKTQIIFRIPLIDSYTTNEDNCIAILNFLSQYKPNKVELLIGHNYAEKKYYLLGKKMLLLPKIRDSFVDEYKKAIELLGIETTICKI